MAGKHTAQTNKKPVAIIVIIAVIAVGLIVGGIIFFMNNGKSPENTNPVTTTAVFTTQPTFTSVPDSQPQTASEAAQSTEAQTSAPNEGQSSAQETQSPATAQNIVVPTEAQGEVTHFNNTYIPNGRAEDAVTGESVSLRDALGASYAEGALTFNDDGTFTDTIVSGIVSSGRYNVQNDNITAIYSDDHNMEIIVTDWNNGVPVKFSVNYGGCIVYFG